MENPDGLRAQLISAPWARRASKRMLLSIIGGRVCAQASPSKSARRLPPRGPPATLRGTEVGPFQLSSFSFELNSESAKLFLRKLVGASASRGQAARRERSEIARRGH